MIDIQKYIKTMEDFGILVFQVFNNDFTNEEKSVLANKALETYYEIRPNEYPYNELADFFVQEISKQPTVEFQNYKIDRMLLEYISSFAVFVLDEFCEDIDRPCWAEVCNDIQKFFVTLSEVLVAAGRSDKLDQVPHVSYMKSMLDELNIQTDAQRSDSKAEIYTPALDFLFQQNNDLKKRFVLFCSTSERNGAKLDATNVVLLLKMILKHNLVDKLKSNRFNLKQLWSELRQLKLIRDGIEDNNLDKARRNPKPPATEVVESWNRFLTSEAK